MTTSLFLIYLSLRGGRHMVNNSIYLNSRRSGERYRSLNMSNSSNSSWRYRQGRQKYLFLRLSVGGLEKVRQYTFDSGLIVWVGYRFEADGCKFVNDISKEVSLGTLFQFVTKPYQVAMKKF